MATIMVVDDTALARESVAKLLEYEGYRALRAKNGKDGWAMMYHDAPDLILLDLMMPEMDGITFLTMLRRSTLWKDLPVIVLTGVTDDDKLISRAWELKVQDLIPKASFGFEDLLNRVKQHLPMNAA
ncbi:MAG TPA: response regulator [Tepidisphaeraceae bacterium]|jgi:DNA-binding response OmpR family regulator|nr:response regulator [Tepidisphaeraceae bacterium]